MSNEENEPTMSRKRTSTESLTQGSGAPMVHNYGSAAEYADAVRAWLWAYHNWYLTQCMAPFYFQQALTANQHQQRISMPTLPIQTATQNGTIPAPNVQQRTQNIISNGVQFVIPTFGRRFMAETIDFFICFVLSLIVTYFLVEVNFIDLDKYEKVFNHEADLKTFIDITQDLFPLEVAKRLCTSIIEAFYLAHGLGTVPAGRTPGKFLMGLKVVPCVAVQAVSPQDYRVIVQLPTETSLSLTSALIRSLIKNFALGFLFPVCVTMYMFRFNRSLYDIAAGTIVVEA